jgi:hypothetical protein
MIGTQIITRINGGRGAEEASLLIGDQEVETVEPVETHGGGKHSITYSKRRERCRVMTTSEIAILGPKDEGVRIVVLGVGADALELSASYVTLPQVRPANVPAKWTTPRPDDAARVLHGVATLDKATGDRIREMRG